MLRLKPTRRRIASVICDVLFPLEAGWDRYRQRDATRAWVAKLEGAAAEIVAQCLAGASAMAEYLGPAPAGSHSSIRAALHPS
jgi:hypothetical protein